MRILLPTLTLGACTPEPSPGQFGEDEEVGCEVASRTPVASTDIVQLGQPGALTPVDVGPAITAAEGQHEHALSWTADNTTTTVTIQVTHRGPIEVVEFASTGSSGDLDLGIQCPTVLSWAADVEVRTVDGRLNEVFVGSISTHVSNVSYLEHLIDTPAGTIDPRALAPSGTSVDADAIRINAQINAGPTTPFSGAIAPAPADDLWGDVSPLASWPDEQSETD